MKHQQRGRLALVREDLSEMAAAATAVGQIRIARGDRGLELRVLIVEAHTEHVHAMLCGEECEWATDTDSVLEPRTTGLPHRLLVHGDVSGSILIGRLGPALGQIDSHLVERIALRGRGLDFTSRISDAARPSATSPIRAGLGSSRGTGSYATCEPGLGWEIYKLGPREE